MNNTKSRLQRTVQAFALLGAFVFACSAYARPAKFAVPKAQIQALGIRTAPLEISSQAVNANFPAHVVIPPNAEQVVSSPLAAMVAEVLVQQNQMVGAGKPLLRIVSPELGQLQLQMLQAHARLTLARQAAQREQKLFDEGIVAQRRVQESQAALQEADATFAQAKSALRLIGMPVTAINRIAASGTPQDSITLFAPRTGIVTEIAVKPGQRVDAAAALLHVVQLDTLWLDIQVPVSESVYWKQGAAVKVQGKDIQGRIVSTGPEVSPSTQTVSLRAVIQTKSDQLRAGELVTVELPLPTASQGWEVPLSAVAYDGNQAYLFVRTADGFEARPVKVLAGSAQRVRVQGQLKAGEQAAISGVVALKGAWLDEKERK